MEEEVWKDEEDARTQVMEGFRFLSIEHWAKRMILTVSAEEQVNSFLEVSSTPHLCLLPFLLHPG